MVHGAVVPTLRGVHQIDKPNNEKFCFYDLDSFLYKEGRYNVFSFEYANTRSTDPSGTILFGYHNYESLADYGKMLIEAIGIAKDYIKNPRRRSRPHQCYRSFHGSIGSQICCPRFEG